MTLLFILLTLAARIQIPATYEGQTPCADCSGIRETLTLRVDKTYSLRRTYLRAPQPDVNAYETGSYSVQSHGVTLGDGKTAQHLELLKHGSLVHKSMPTAELKRMPVVDPIYTLEGATWKLTQVNSRSVTSTAEIDFKDKKMTGSNGCNRMFGGYEVDGNKLKLGPIGATKMACPEPAMKVESAFMKVMETVDGYRISVQTLELLHGADPVATFIAK